MMKWIVIIGIARDFWARYLYLFCDSSPYASNHVHVSFTNN